MSVRKGFGRNRKLCEVSVIINKVNDLHLPMMAKNNKENIAKLQDSMTIEDLHYWRTYLLY